MGDYGGTVVGIDLGTTYSRVAVSRNNCVTVIPNENGNLHTPSCVAFTDTGILIGDAAKDHASEYPTNTISNIKRVLEISFSDPSMQSGTKHWQFKVVGGDLKNKLKIVVNGNGKEEKLEPEEVVSLLFAQLKENAENHLGSKVKNAVVTVPASFNDSQREAMTQAAYMAGLSVVLLEEPIATLLAYGLEKENEDSSEERNVLVFDFGGGSLDVSVVAIQGGELKVKATIEDTDLGGEYFDDSLAKYCQLQLMVDTDENAEVLGRLRAVAERARFILSSGNQSSARTSALVDEVGWEESFTLVMLERMNQYQFQPCIKLVVQCLKDACVEKSQIDDVIIVGGLSNIPIVQELMQSYFEGKKLHKSIQLDEVIVHGAAIHAAMLSEEHFEKNREETETTTETFDDVDDDSSHSVLEWEHSDSEHTDISCSTLEEEHADHDDNSIIYSLLEGRRLVNNGDNNNYTDLERDHVDDNKQYDTLEWEQEDNGQNKKSNSALEGQHVDVGNNNTDYSALEEEHVHSQDDSTSYSALEGEQADNENEHGDKSSNLQEKTGGHKYLNWIWIASVAVIATASLFFAPKACPFLQKRQGLKQRLAAAKDADKKECSKYLLIPVRREK